MPFISALPEDANLGSVYTTNPQYYLPLVEFSAIMHLTTPIERCSQVHVK